MAGVEWNWMKVYRMMPVRKMGMETKRPVETKFTYNNNNEEKTWYLCTYLFLLLIIFKSSDVTRVYDMSS